MKKRNVLVVCLGNICRSPLAQGIFEHCSNHLSIKVDSAGTANYHSGNAPDPRSIKTAAIHGIDISHQQARQFIATDFRLFDYIYVMDQENMQNVLKLAQSEADKNKVKLLLGSTEVEDLYYGGELGFELVFDKTEKACKQILASWKH